jgi:hypothetical protein
MKTGWDIDFRYVFSGSLTSRMHDMLLDTIDFEPLNILVAQEDRSGIKQAIEWKDAGFCQWLFCDSGAYSVHTGKLHVTQDEYVDYINSVSGKIDVFAQLDTIPGQFKKPKSPQDYIDSAESSWENFLHMRENVKDKHKVMPVYHFGEDVKYLKRMLEYRDSEGDQLDYIGLSPANDASVQARMLYLKDMYDIIQKSSNPNVKTHVYGFTSLTAMSKFPCYSADSISHRLVSGYNKIFTQNFGIISVSKQPRTVKSKSNLSFLETADSYNLDILRSEFKEFGIDLDFAKKYGFEGDDILDWIPDDNNIRVVFSIRTIQKLCKTTYKYQKENLVTQKKLF